MLAVVFLFALAVPSAKAADSDWPFGKAAASATPFSGFGDSASADGPSDDSQEVGMLEKPFNALSNQEIDDMGQVALAIKPGAWKHAETDHFILHYRRMTEAKKVAREVEFDIGFIAATMGAKPADYAKKSHVFVFQDDIEWADFLDRLKKPSWIASFAYRDELFLNLRSTTPGAVTFDSRTLAHETTHAVVARLYPNARWPLWLNEGFAEYMAGASLAARKNQPLMRHEHALNFATMSLDTLQGLQVYPEDPVQVAQLYETAEKLVRFIFTELPHERFLQFATAVSGGKSLKDALLAVYPDKIASYDDFLKKYGRFTK